jgi:6-phosphogluconolactonase (cycloisomerase 2 family)
MCTDAARQLTAMRLNDTEGLDPGYTPTSNSAIYAVSYRFYVANYLSGSLHSYRIDTTTGRVHPVSFEQYTDHTSVVPDRQEGPHVRGWCGGI